MPTDFYAYQRQAEALCRELGFDSDEVQEGLRNRGGNRTPAKRELLSRFERRAIAAGKSPQRSYY